MLKQEQIANKSTAVGCAADFALAGIPWFYIAKLNINRREKVAIGIAMSVGFL